MKAVSVASASATVRSPCLKLDDVAIASRECVCEQSPVLGRSDDQRRITRLETGREKGSDGVRQLTLVTVDLNAVVSGRGTTQELDPTSRHSRVVAAKRRAETSKPAHSATITMAA